MTTVLRTHNMKNNIVRNSEEETQQQQQQQQQKPRRLPQIFLVLLILIPIVAIYEIIMYTETTFKFTNIQKQKNSIHDDRQQQQQRRRRRPPTSISNMDPSTTQMILIPQEPDQLAVSRYINQTLMDIQYKTPGSGGVGAYIIGSPQYVGDGQKEELQQQQQQQLTSQIEQCPPTAQLRFLIRNSINNNDKTRRMEDDTNEYYWIVQTLDQYGQPKTVGGDEFYIEYYDHVYSHIKAPRPTAVAILNDWENGEYQLDFVTPPMESYLRKHDNSVPHTPLGIGTLMVHMQYTCNIGKIIRPGKNSWTNNGSLRRSYSYDTKNVTMPPIRDFEQHNSFHTSSSSSINLSNYKNVICFGDSIINNFCGMWWNKYLYHKSNTNCYGNCCGSEMDPTTYEIPFLTRLEEYHGQDLNQSQSIRNSIYDDNNNNNENEDDDPTTKNGTATTALILGAAVWDLLEPMNISRWDSNFDDHIEGCRQFIQTIQQRYPHVDIYWKLPNAIHVQAVGEGCYNRNLKRGQLCSERTRYMSDSLLKFLYNRQKQLMKELHIPVIDLYEATYLSASWLMQNDGRHYLRWLNELMNDWYYPGMETHFPTHTHTHTHTHAKSK